MALNAKSYLELKKNGFIRQKQENFCSARCKSSAGEFTVAQLMTIKNVAEKFGKNFIHITSRQGIDIPFIPLEKIDEVKKILSVGGVEVVTGMTITACKGTEICNFAWIDTTRLAKNFQKLFGGRELPHKFKIGFSGCPNDCMKVSTNDIGIKGGVIPMSFVENCKFCGACAVACPVKIISVNRKEKIFSLDSEKCINCGRCVRACHFDALRAEVGFKNVSS